MWLHFNIILISTFFSCQTLVVQNSHVKQKSYFDQQTEWNHTGIFGLVNYTDDFQINRLCPDKAWSHVTLERGTMAAVAEGSMLFAAILRYPFASIANLFWDPLTFSWACSDQRRRSHKNRPDPIYTSAAN